MVDLYNVGTYNADTRFKAGYLNELEGMLEKVLPHALLMVKPNLESKIRTAQTTADIVEEINAEDVATANNLEERNNYRGCEDDVLLNEMDVSTIKLQPPKPNQVGSTSLKNKKKINDGIEQISTSIGNVAMLLRENILIIGLELCKSIASEK
ncbi:hypothetical protein Golob_027859 [Gossypium lobatum]|uniref:Uncharacterized protein n=1 Tax=Gossypium lobatum TaxID=34289 RepID=A0A7J8NDX2_9ROSI|nr:hypothetical protein [Gossypium lobatum]